MKRLVFFTIFIMLTGCGGGGGSSSENTQSDQSNILDTPMNDGGMISSPTPLDFQQFNRITNDSFVNYFNVQAKAGDQLIIQSYLDGLIEPVDNRDCVDKRGSYNGISISGEEHTTNRSCSTHFLTTFTRGGSYTLHLDFESDKRGYFVASMISSESEPILLPDEGLGGIPDTLGSISLDSENLLSANSFLNHYGYQGTKGETIFFQAYINRAEDTRTTTVCGDRNLYRDLFAFGWVEMTSDLLVVGDYHSGPRYSCSHDFSFTLPEDGLYHFNFRSIVGGEGYFLATVL